VVPVIRLQAGAAAPPYEVVVDAQAMKPMALLLRDPNPIHLDPRIVASLGLGDRVINQGPANVGYVWECLARWLEDASRVRSLDVRFTSNAYDGDRLVATAVVREVDESAAEAIVDVLLRTAEGRDLLVGTARVGAEEP
jgi:acyl dehydratase